MDSSSTDTRNSKKRKASYEPMSGPSAAKSRRRRSSKFWFDDGNIVLQTPGIMFRVHKGILKLHSTIFADMFAMPQPHDQPTLEGCPVVELTDADDDWKAFLGILYHTDPLYIEKNNVICTRDMLAMLRLGHKYSFEHFKDSALAQLRQIYPRTIEGLDVVLENSPSRPESIFQLQLVPAGDEFQILETIANLRIETILPVAYYFCVRNRSLADILTGRDQSATADDTDHLSAETKAALIIGKEKILLEYPKLTFAWWCRARPSATCLSKVLCKLDALTVAGNLTRVKWGINLALDPLNDYGGLCTQCDIESQAAHHTGRQAFIDALPSYFGLPPWDQLKDF